MTTVSQILTSNEIEEIKNGISKLCADELLSI